MTNSPPPDVWLGDLIHFDGRHDAGLHFALFQRILKCQRIDHGRQHPHLVSGNTIHQTGLFGNATEEIAPTHDNGDFYAQVTDGHNLE